MPNAASALLIHGPDSWGDVSYSAIFSTTDTAGSVGLISSPGPERQQLLSLCLDARNADGSGSRQVVKVAVRQRRDRVLHQNLGAGGGYTVNRWYHLEIRSLGREHQVYLDGQRVFD